MAERSIPWGGTVIGHAGPYTDDDWSDIWRKLFVYDRAKQGILLDYTGELAVSGIASPISVATGAALVDGKFYESDTAVNVVVPTPTVATRYDRIVLRKSWAAQTVLIARLEGVEGAGVPPAVTQVDGTTWEISLATVEVTIAGVITVTDVRNYAVSRLGTIFGPGGARTISAGVVTIDENVFWGFSTEGAAAEDDLDTISGGFLGQVIAVRNAAAGRTVRLTTAGNLDIGSPITLVDGRTFVWLRMGAATWQPASPRGGADILQIQVFS